VTLSIWNLVTPTVNIADGSSPTDLIYPCETDFSIDEDQADTSLTYVVGGSKLSEDLSLIYTKNPELCDEFGTVTYSLHVRDSGTEVA
jgi:hypothetical protein